MSSPVTPAISLSIAHLGPVGTYTEAAAIAYSGWLDRHAHLNCRLTPYANISKTLRSLATGDSHLAVIPVENSIQGSVTVSLDTLWEQEGLSVQQAIVLPIHHALISHGTTLAGLRAVCSHPQALAQCQHWLERHLPHVKLRSTSSTAEALQDIAGQPDVAAIASERAAHLYDLPILAHPINDRPENCTRFWVVRAADSAQPLPQAPGSRYRSLAFSLPQNAPGALLTPLQILANRGINMTRIESRPTKRSLGEYLFFIEVEADRGDRSPAEWRSLWQGAIVELKQHTEVLKVFGNYTLLHCDEFAGLSASDTSDLDDRIG